MSTAILINKVMSAQADAIVASDTAAKIVRDDFGAHYYTSAELCGRYNLSPTNFLYLRRRRDFPSHCEIFLSTKAVIFDRRFIDPFLKAMEDEGILEQRPKTTEETETLMKETEPAESK